MKIIVLAFGVFLLVGMWLPFHGGAHIAIGLICMKYAPGAYGYLAAALGGIELLLLWWEIPCLLVGESGTVDTYMRRPYEAPWKLGDSQPFDGTSEDPIGWLIGSLHSFALAGVYAVCAYFDLFAVSLG